MYTVGRRKQEGGESRVPRPVKSRRVCAYPRTLEFYPADGASEKPPILLAVDEYEVLRLIDSEGLSQEDCAARMQIARTTVQRIYGSARKKLADCIVGGRALRIGGGDFRLCGGQGRERVCEGCRVRLCYEQHRKEKGEATMRIAITYENGQVFQHFGHTAHFKLYDVEDGRILSSEVVDTNGSGHGTLAGILQALRADVLICGGIGGGAQSALAAAGIRLCGGVTGDADAAAEAFAAGRLAHDPNVKCSHHHHSHGKDHVCGEHGCGQGHCGGHN